MDSTKTRFGDAQKYQDVGSAIGFLVHIGMVVGWIGFSAAAGKYSTAGSGAVSFLHKKGGVVAFLQNPGNASTEDNTSIILIISLVAVLLAIIWSGIWLVLLQVCPSQIVTASVVSLPVICLVVAVLCFSIGQVVSGGIMLLVAVLSAVWAWWVWDRIEYTSHLVKTASTTYSKSKGIFGVAVALVLGQAVWTVVWVLAVFPICNGNAGNLVLLWPVFLFSYFWTSTVISNILFVACCGVMARHYFNTDPENCVGHSVAQACTTSLGSICFGSLIMAVVKTLKFLCKQAQQTAEEDGNPVAACLACVGSCILGCIESIVELVNTFAFIYVAIYGMNFWDAATEVFTLMQETDGLTNYSLLEVVGFFGMLTGGAITGAMAAVMAWRAGLTGGLIFGLFCLGFVIGMAIMSVVSRMVEGGALTIFVCYTEEPKILEVMDAELVSRFGERKSMSAKA